MSTKICQSCGMPLEKDPNQGGTNADHSKSNTYCSFCYQDGKFYDEGCSLQEKIEKNIHLAVTKLGITESNARTMAESILPNLERWKEKK
jgi:hypothetical protein